MVPCRPLMTNEHPRRLLPFLLVGLVAIAAHAGSFGAGWIWDDDSYITGNLLLSSPRGWLDLWIPGRTPQYYPLVFLGFWIQYALAGDAPASYHAVNVVMHAANAALLFGVLHRIGLRHALWIAMLFAAHPMGVESVAWVTERKNVQSMFFALGAMLVFLHAMDAKGTRGTLLRVVAFLLYACALLSKTTAVFVAPTLAFAMLWMRRPIDARAAFRLAPYFILGAALGLFTAYIEKTQVGASGSDFTLGLAERIQQAGSIAAFYPVQFLVPLEQVFIYPRIVVDASDPIRWIPTICLVVILCASTFRWRAHRGPLLWWLWYLAAIFPALGFIDVWPFRYSQVADHFAYAAMPALATAAVLAIDGLMRLMTGGASAREDRAKEDAAAPVAIFATRLATAILAMAVVASVALSIRAATKYDDEETLWIATAESNPDAWIAHNNLASIRLREAGEAIAQGDGMGAERLATDALSRAQRAGELKPDEFTNAVNRSEALRILGRHLESLAEINDAIGLAPMLPDLHWMRGRVLELTEDRASAIASYRDAARLGAGGPDEVVARRDLMRLAVAAGDNAAALEECRRLVELTPDDTDTVANLGSLLVANGNLADGRRELLRALTMNDSGTPFRHPSAWFATVSRYLRLAADVKLEGDERRRAGIVALQLASLGGNDPAARFLGFALRMGQGDESVRPFLEQLRAEVEAGGGTELAAEIQRFLDSRPASP
ncbi:MAG: O-GlcNAc transferase [Planctomycetota bacterium]